MSPNFGEFFKQRRDLENIQCISGELALMWKVQIWVFFRRFYRNKKLEIFFDHTQFTFGTPKSMEFRQNHGPNRRPNRFLAVNFTQSGPNCISDLYSQHKGKCLGCTYRIPHIRRFFGIYARFLSHKYALYSLCNTHMYDNFFLQAQLCEDVTFECVEKKNRELNRWKGLD